MEEQDAGRDLGPDYDPCLNCPADIGCGGMEYGCGIEGDGFRAGFRAGFKQALYATGVSSDVETLERCLKQVLEAARKRAGWPLQP